jgi:hypothetical protein
MGGKRDGNTGATAARAASGPLHLCGAALWRSAWQRFCSEAGI